MTDTFDARYRDGTPPWDIGRPQRVVARWIEDGLIDRRARVLDVGCGTGENTILLAAHGVDVTGVDMAPTAIAKAKEKAEARGGSSARFVVGDALALGGLGLGLFDLVIDSALFHVFSDEARPRYAESLSHVTRPGARVYVLCFSDEEPNWGGPRRVTQAEIRATFGPPFEVERIEASAYETNLPNSAARAWLSTIARRG